MFVFVSSSYCVSFPFSVDTGKRQEMLNVRVSATICTSTGPGFSAFTKSSLLTLSGKQPTPGGCYTLFSHKS